MSGRKKRNHRGTERQKSGGKDPGRRNYFADLSDQRERGRQSRSASEAPARRQPAGVDKRRGAAVKEQPVRGIRLGETARLLIRLLFFPAFLLYLEIVFHLYMSAPMAYVPIWAAFALSGGLVLTALTLPFVPRVNGILMKVFAVFFPLLYVVEIVAKTILQNYYAFSSLGMAAGNKLTDYLDAIIPTVVKTVPIGVVLFLPAILLFLLGKRAMGFERYNVVLSGVALAAAVILHLLGLGVVHLPWKGDLTPARLYNMDSNLDDQVEQLGLWTALRLDAKHMIFPVKNDLGDDFSNLGPGTQSSAQPSEGPSAPVETERPLDTSPNVMDVDLAAIAESAGNDDVKWLASYFNSVTPTNKNEYTGMFKGYNVIFFTLEGFSGYAIDPVLTPTLYKMTHEGFVFNNFYTALHFTSTSGGECQNLLGLYPKNGSPATMTRTGTLGTNCYFNLAEQLKRQGYQALGYHANGDMYGRNLSHPNLGLEWHQYGESGVTAVGDGHLLNFEGLDVSSGGDLLWPQKDTVLVEASIDDYINSDQPFYVYYLTISGHMPYSANRVVTPYEDTVRALTQYSETTQNYLATCMEVDRAMKLLIDKLDAAGKLDNTLIVAAPDHIPYFNVDTLEELAGKKLGSSDDLVYIQEGNIDFDVYKSSLIIWSASMEDTVKVDKVCCQVDILPTVSNLLGLEYDSRMLDGTDILSDSEGMVVFSSRCWMTDRGFYNRFTQEFTPAEGVAMTAEEQEEYVDAMRRLAGYKVDSTSLLVENDFYDYVFG